MFSGCRDTWPGRRRTEGGRRPRRGLTRRGFTLLEVMIALALVAIALVAVLRTQGQGLALTEEARARVKEVFLARAVLAEVENQADLYPGVTTERFEKPDDGFAWEREVEPLPGPPGLYRVRVRVHRHDRPPTEGVALEGFVYRGGR
ncbi:MAG: prepilin-type N-terminal cleavage/methylation domain-containing protein [Thermodesulfobacteriota bacterium]